MQNRINKKFSPRLSPSGGIKKKFCDVSTNTSVDFVCEKCAEREQFDYTESEAFRASYLKSINYINCCHSLMNELLYRKTGRYTAKLPDMPNFMDVLAVLQTEDGGSRGGLIEKGVVTDGRQQCDKGCGGEIVAAGKPTQDYQETQSDVSEEDMDRYAQELLLTSSNGNAPRYQCFQVQTTKPQCCPPSENTKQHKRHSHLTNLNLLKQLQENNNNNNNNDDEENSDTDYIPSDDDCDSSPKQKQLPAPTQETSKSSIATISHPLKLNQRSLHMLDENALNKIGLFNENGELQMDAIKILEAERHYRAKDARNKQFRRRRASSDTKAFEKRKFAAAADSAADLSDIKSESELETVNNKMECCNGGGVIKVISGFKGNTRKS